MKKKQRQPPTVKQGVVQKNPRGFAFLLPDQPGDDDVYVPKESADALKDGDRVQYKVLFRRGRPFAEILKVVSRARRAIIGRMVFEKKSAYVTYSGGNFLLRKTSFSTPSSGCWVQAKIEEYPSEDGPGLVSIEKAFGEELTPKEDYAIATALYGLKEEFGPAAVTEAASQKQKANLSSVPKGRVDLTSVPLVTIDGEDAKDFDDAVAAIRSADGNIVLYVSIADVAHYVTPGSALDTEAADRATSVYFPGFCLPMLPEVISNDLCSLRPKENRFSVTVEIHYNRDAEVVRVDFYNSFIRTFHRLTYTEVQDFLDKKMNLPTEAVCQSLHLMYALYKTLAKRRKQRGGLDFDLSECEIQVDKDGKPINLGPARRLDSHRLIEEFMIAANEQVAKKLFTSEVQSLYRVHETPKAESLEEINTMLKVLGISQHLKEITPRALSQLLETTRQHRSHHTLHQIVLRLQKQARYEPTARGHFGLALSDYTHFTSPIRRYPDLVVHRALKRLIGDEVSADNEDEEDSLARIALHSSAKERTAMEAERFVDKRKQCWFMKDRLGESYEAKVGWIIERGLFLEIPQFATEGFLPMERLPGHYEFDPDAYCLKSFSDGKQISLGDVLSVLVAKVSLEDNVIEFDIV